MTTTPAQQKEMLDALSDGLHSWFSDLRKTVALELSTLRRDVEARLTALEQTQLKYVGTYSPGETYQENSLCTLGGALWVCRHQTMARPGVDGSWQLCVKRGGA